MQAPLSACGYSFVGGCSTHIGLSINGTQDSFPVGTCASGASFGGLQLGSIRTLQVISAHAITWESCTNNVTDVTLYYRVYEMGGAAGAWKTMLLPEVSTHLEGPYTTRFRSKYVDYDITQGLTTGKNYLMEVYYMAAVDTIGDDFIPETTLLQNNNGQNYKLSFQYGGPSAPPFTTIVTHNEAALCHGDSSGVAGVMVFGDPVNLRYNWANSPDNYHTVFNLAAGTYTVTVTSANASPQIRRITIGQPAPINASFSNIEPAGCNNSPGLATITAYGGTPTYQYSWSSGSTGPVGSLPTAGTWIATVTDGNNCKKSFFVQVSGTNTTAERNISAEICQEEVYKTNGLNFTRSGIYQFSIPNAAGCDTIVYLTLKVVAPDSAFINLPDSTRIVCLSPSIDLCAAAMPGSKFIWEKNNITLSDNACYTAVSGGNYVLTHTLIGTSKTCAAKKTIFVAAKLQPPVIEVAVSPTLFSCHSDSATVTFTAKTTAEKPVFEWKLNDTIIATRAFCSIKLPVSAWAAANLHLNVTDAYGCQSNYEQPPITVIAPAPLLINTAAAAASGANKADGTAAVTVFGGNAPYRYLWSNGQTSANVGNLLPGVYCVTVTEANGCTIKGCQQVTFTIATRDVLDKNGLSVFPNPVTRGAAVHLNLPKEIENGAARYTMTDIRGVLYEEGILYLQQPAFRIPSNVPAGLFLLRLQTDQGMLSARIFVSDNQ